MIALLRNLPHRAWDPWFAPKELLRSVLVRAKSKLARLADLKGRKIAVIGGTTNERAVNAQLKARQLSATVVPFKSPRFSRRS